MLAPPKDACCAVLRRHALSATIVYTISATWRQLNALPVSQCQPQNCNNKHLHLYYITHVASFFPIYVAYGVELSCHLSHGMKHLPSYDQKMQNHWRVSNIYKTFYNISLLIFNAIDLCCCLGVYCTAWFPAARSAFVFSYFVSLFFCPLGTQCWLIETLSRFFSRL